ncbi:exodeoxyribonuclease V subunit gamma [Shewanella fodinae]|uniref:exodeoxyribonuclease V subunit gamma n=1 Tax=Shewanella fodinae TaxID=552357 RepID=UPI0016764096|nr:exodeoxyribonuclease V subunit gamma [Shewanella fodinae]MCL2905653.1 exodeoxyribonuclease V subunit gamma [Shewanella fodinae]GGY92669.1 RecBCD enzyme subunit RecC [Shewanella fodinae]
MFTLIQSNKMELLSAALADQLRTPIAGQSPLTEEQILVQSPGMSTWLRLEIAKHNGIAAALNFPLPSSFVWDLCHQLLPDVPKENAFTKEAMTWKLLGLLPTLIGEPLYAPLQRYLGDDSKQLPLKQFQLAARIADIFDQYLVYRPDWIAAWEAEQLPFPLNDEQQWQPQLWRQLRQRNQQLGLSGYHRANLHQALVSILRDDQQALPQLPARLFVFGISSMPPQMLSVLQALGHRLDVTVFSLSPCQHYWGDIVNPKTRARINLAYSEKRQLPENWQDSLIVGNPLLANNGKLGRDLLDLLLELPPEDIALGDDLFYPAGNANLLQGLQQDILEMETRGRLLGPDSELYLSLEGRRILRADDDSLTLRSCHSPLREVETLHDHLQWLFAREPQLSAKDIVVMMPDVAAYAPYIDAVFSRREGQYYIPYAIADRGASQESPLISSFLQLLDINNSRFALTEVLTLLELPATLKRFGLDEEALSQIRQWLEQAGVRWGRSGTARQQQHVPAFEQNSWAEGVRRLILGYALEDDSDLFSGHLPVAGVEGQAAQALGKLLNFIEALDNTAKALSIAQPAAVRIQQLSEFCLQFYAPEEDSDTKALMAIHNAIAKLASELSNAGFDGELEQQLLLQWFRSQLEESRVGQRYLAGAVNFCTLMPMRSIPFQVVCLLGMNDGIYPRVQHPVGFDLMAQQAPRRGDRSRRLDDRYLFLEALLSARRQLYISYIGRSQRDNSPRNPSMLVAELLEYCQLTCLPESLVASLQGSPLNANTLQQLETCLTHMLVKQQPLQPFDAALYQPALLAQPASVPFTPSFSLQWCPQPDAAVTEDFLVGTPLPLSDATSEDSAAPQIIELQALIRFFRNPAQYFFNRCLKLDLGLDLNADDNDEPFTLNALQRYQLQLLMVQDALKHDGIRSTTLTARLKASGQLPNKPFDDLLLGRYQQDVAPLLDRTLYLRGEQQQTLTVDLPFPELACRLHGRLDDISAKGLISCRPGGAKGRDIVRLYLRHLALNASGWQRYSFLLDMGNFHALAPMTNTEAKQQLLLWLRTFAEGQSQPLPFMPQTSLAYAMSDGQSHGERLEEAKAAWDDRQGKDGNLLPGEGSEPHYQRCFSFPDSFTENSFGMLALTLLSPLVNRYQHGELHQLAEFVANGGKEPTHE